MTIDKGESHERNFHNSRPHEPFRQESTMLLSLLLMLWQKHKDTREPSLCIF